MCGDALRATLAAQFLASEFLAVRLLDQKLLERAMVDVPIPADLTAAYEPLPAEAREVVADESEFLRRVRGGDEADSVEINYVGAAHMHSV